MKNMKTIVKGKNMKNTYKLVNDDHFYSFRYWGREPDIIKDIHDMIYHEDWTRIETTQEFVSYDTYIILDDVSYRLNIGEEYDGDIIEKVEGTKEGDIVYYTEKILTVDENLEEKQRLEKELYDRKEYLKGLLERKIAERNKKKWWQFWRSDK
jgi:signal peptidase I